MRRHIMDLPFAGNEIPAVDVILEFALCRRQELALRCFVKRRIRKVQAALSLPTLLVRPLIKHI